MKFETFTQNHIEDCVKLTLTQYYEEQMHVSILPDGDYYDQLCDTLSEMVDHKLGVVALDEDTIVSFISGYGPISNLFGTSNGIFVPIHGHGALSENRKHLYSRLYQEAAKIWVKQGILSHSIAVYAHDTNVVDSFFWNGFGLRCIDAICKVDKIACRKTPSIFYSEVIDTGFGEIAQLDTYLVAHLNSSPMFMPRKPRNTSKSIEKEIHDKESRYFVAKDSEKIIGYIKISDSGETFACEAKDMANICGAYLLPEYRGRGIYTALLSYLMDVLIEEGIARCGVDFESLNPTASGFWLKHFIPYTYSVTRRIDERVYKP